ncbi:TetR/AcrR family transcriptional regulator [Agromyces silvae]|uniref:TetR/AcrR family transcriptional regulator n=1 Tax=Agromyces silvae TaxID=3388266 RepID=UPI00280A7CBD|nr:TetR/AcrR family transcriptional regulator C-terminal domain-containing protein [Agromyces protaetiae]
MGYWEHRKPVIRSRAIDVGDLARAAAALLDAGGLRSLTLRAVASQLDVAPASLYSRVASVDDLFDLALDRALADDPAIDTAVRDADLMDLMLTYYRHLVRHPWAPQVIAWRAPRGPSYIRLSERMIALLTDAGSSDPLTSAYILSNFVIGCATTAPMAVNEAATEIDRDVAPLYARAHARHAVDPEAVVGTGLRRLLSRP